MNNREIGAFCETYVCTRLQSLRFTILARNFRLGRGPEIDVIAQKDSVIHFMEVKARSQSTYGLPREAVSTVKMQSIIKASEAFIAQYGTYNAKRAYDVAEVYFSKKAQNQLQIVKLNLLYHAFGG